MNDNGKHGAVEDLIDLELGEAVHDQRCLPVNIPQNCFRMYVGLGTHS